MEAALLRQYPTLVDFGNKFNIHAVSKYGKKEYLDAAINGNYCTLKGLQKAYGEGAPQAWLIIQLTGLSQALGLTDKTTRFQLEEIAEMLYDDWGWLKYTEFLQAFRYLRKLYYYGRFDTSTILNGFKDWNRLVRVPTIERLEKSEQMKREEEWKRKAVPMPESCKNKLNQLLNKFSV